MVQFRQLSIQHKRVIHSFKVGRRNIENYFFFQCQTFMTGFLCKSVSKIDFNWTFFIQLEVSLDLFTGRIFVTKCFLENDMYM